MIFSIKLDVSHIRAQVTEALLRGPWVQMLHRKKGDKFRHKKAGKGVSTIICCKRKAPRWLSTLCNAFSCKNAAGPIQLTLSTLNRRCPEARQIKNYFACILDIRFQFISLKTGRAHFQKAFIVHY